MKTILFHVNTFLAGGIEKVLIELLNAMDPDKYRIRLSIGYNFGDKEVLKPLLPAHVEVCYLLENPLLLSTHKKKKTGNLSVLEKLFGEAFFPPFIKRLQRKALQQAVADVDVVIDFDTTLAGFYKVFADKKSAAYCHFSFAQIWSGAKRKGNKLARRLSHYDKIVMLCDEMKEETAAIYPQLAPKLVRIYNALNVAEVQKRAEEPVNTGLPPHEKYIVSVGRLQESQKDFTTLIRAYATCVSQYGISERLVIVGDGGSMESLQQLSADLGMSERIVFAGFQANPYPWIKGADLFLFSSKYEGLPTVIIEALILGKAVIATACPTGVRELLMHGEAGILTPVGDVNAMTEAIYRLINNVPEQEQFVMAAKSILKNFDTQFMIREFERLLVE